MSRRRAPILAAVAALVALVAAACGDSGTLASSTDTGFVEGSGAVTKVAEADRLPAPDVSGKTLDGEAISLRDYKGKVVVLNIWGSWCPPCRKEAPALVAASKALASKGVAFVGINTRDPNIVPAQEFVRKSGITYPNLYDPDGRVLLGFRETVPATAIPSTLVIDAQGRVAARIVGGSTRRTFEQLALDVAARR